MARLNALGHGRVEGPKLDPRDIIIRSGFNFRDTTTPEARAHIEWLKQSIRENGVQEPIRVEYVDSKVYLVNGECRVRACLELWEEGFSIEYEEGKSGPPLCPSIVVKGDEAEVLAASLIANGSLPPSQIEFGAAVARLVKLGMSMERASDFTPAHIAKNHRVAMQYTRDALELHQAPLEVKEQVMHGVDGVKVTPAAAVSAVRKSRTKAAEVIREAAAKARTEGRTEVKRPKTAGEATRQKQNDSMALTIGDRLAQLAIAAKPDLVEMVRQARLYIKARTGKDPR